MPTHPYGHVDLVLAQAVREGIIDRFEATIIGAIRLDKTYIKLLAEEYGTTMIELNLAMKIAEDRLIEWIMQGGGQLNLRSRNPRQDRQKLLIKGTR
jgi:hypothetical protein